MTKTNLTKTEEKILKEFEALYVRREIPKGANTWNTGESQLEFLRQALRQQREEVVMKIRNDIVEFRKEFANTPLDKRGNGWDWLDKLEDKIITHTN